MQKNSIIRNKYIRAITLLFALSIMITGCIDYKKIVEENSQKQTPGDTTGETDRLETVLDDVNNDGKNEKLVLEDRRLILYSGSRICGKFEVSDEYKYKAINARAKDIDNDEENEILVMLECNSRENYLVSNVVIINICDNDIYEVWSFPEEIESGFSDSGLSADVSVKDKFVYSVSANNNLFDIDVSRLYGISLLDKDGLEKAEKQWNKIEESNFHGEIIGIYDVKVMRETGDNNLIYIYEYISGGDNVVIGSMVFCISYDSDGKYTVEKVLLGE